MGVATTSADMYRVWWLGAIPLDDRVVGGVGCSPHPRWCQDCLHNYDSDDNVKVAVGHWAAKMWPKL